jgi:hypothetical protein
VPIADLQSAGSFPLRDLLLPYFVQHTYPDVTIHKTDQPDVTALFLDVFGNAFLLAIKDLVAQMWNSQRPSESRRYGRAGSSTIEITAFPQR